MREKIFHSLGQMKCGDDQIDQLDSDKGNDETAEAVNQQVALQHSERARWSVSDTSQRKRDQRNYNEGVEDNGAQDRAGGGAQVHDVERRNLGKCGHQHRGYDCKILRDVVRDAECGEGTARDQHLFSDLDDVEQLRWVGIKIDHVTGFTGSLRAGVHGNTDVGLREGWGVIRAIASHGNQMTLRLLLAYPF